MAADDHHSTVSNTKHGKTTATGATSPNGTKKPKERVPVKPELTEINQYLMCPLCSGYFIDATAIIECQHTFCKSCILKYLETNSYCPICDVQLNNAKPHMSLRSDVILQRLVYKLVPGSLVSELRRRRDFAVSKDSDGVEAAELVSNGMALEVEAATDLSTILSLEDVCSLSIEYFRSCDGEDTVPKEQLVHQKQDQQPTTNAQDFQDIKTSACSHEEANDRTGRRYLQCPAAVSVALLKKFIRMKYGLSDDYRVDLLYNGVRDNILENDLTLLDVAFIFKWNKDEPMRFHYRIFDRTAKSSIVARAGTKRSHPSMMDEPPDDDSTAASGPQNRSSMTSTSPSSKLPRLSTGTGTSANNNTGSTGKSSSRTTSTASASATLAYDFCEEGNSSENDKMKKGKYRGIHRKNSGSSTGSNSNSNNLSKSSSHGLKKSPSSSLRSHLSRSQSQSSEAGKASETGIANANRRSMSTNTTSGNRIIRSNSVGNSGNDIKSEEGDSDSLEGVRTDGSKNSIDSTVTNSNRLRSASQQVIQSQQLNGSLKFSISTALGSSKACEEKREPLKLSLGSLSKSPERKHKHKHHKMKHKEKNKSLKFTFPLNPSLNQTVSNQSMQAPNQSHQKKSSGKEMKMNIGKSQQNPPEFGNRKAGDGKGNANVSGGSSNNNNQNSSNVPNSVKTSTSAHLSSISKSISVSIGVSGNNNMTNTSSSQNANKGNQYGNKNMSSGLLPKNTGIEIQSTTLPQVLTNSQQNSNSHSSVGNNHQSASRSHPLLPDSVHVPKSVTLIPVNPNAMNNPGSMAPGRGNSSGNPPEKSVSGTSNRLNAHTFTHPITNKSLHQITVTEVPPPPKSGRSSPANSSNNNSSSSIGGNSGGANAGNNSSNSGSGCNPIEKVIANAVANKPQFNGPGSMEITKIYCGTKENPAKKLKERKGLDISISVPGMNVNMKDKCKSTQKLEETLRQKIGMGNSATTVTMNNKIKVAVPQQPPTTLLNAKMPPGITIGPAAGMNKSSLNTPNNQQNTNNTGNTIKGLGFTLPPHITAHPQLPPGGGMRNIPPNQLKTNEKNTNRNSNKELTIPNPMNRINSPSSTPPEVMVNGKTNNAKSQMNNQIQSRKQLGEALASMFDMASRNVMKSPSPPKTSSSSSAVKDKGQMPSAFTSNHTNRDDKSSSNCDKRPLDMSSSSRKNSRESPEPKRPRGNETSGSKSSSSHETPLDLSGRSSRPGSASSNSSSSSPGLGSSKSNQSSPTEKSKSSETYNNSSSVNSNNKQRTPTPTPKVSPSSLSNSGNFSSSPNAKQNAECLKNSMKSLVASTAGTQTASSPSILSIAQSLAQKQLQQQQQQNLHNQIMQLHQSMHANQNPSNQGKSGSLGTSLKGIGTGGHNTGNMNHGGTLNSMGLSSLSPPIIPMPNPSPPGTSFDPLRNLLTLSDVALRHGKVHPMNNLMAAAGLCPPPPPHSHAMSLSGSPSAVTTAGIFSHLPQHLLNSLGSKSSSGILDPGSHAHLFGNLAALSAAHNERLAVAAGMNHHFGGSLSPPLSLTNSFYSQQIRPPSSSPHGSLRIPTVTPKSNSSNNIKKGSTPPLSFSHPPPHSLNNSSTKSQASPPTSNPTTFSSTSPSTNVTYSSSSSKSSDSTSSTASKNIKVNGSLSNTFPLLPPGIHNPLMPTNRSLPTLNVSSSSSTMSKNSIINTSAMNMNTKVVTNNSNNNNVNKKGIPNSMKISNFLPSKPKDGKAEDSSNVEATITSGSHVKGTSLTKFLNSIPPLIVSQSQTNLSVSSPPKDSASSRLLSSPTKSSNVQEFMNVCTNSSATSSSHSDNIDSSTKSSVLLNSIKNEPGSSPNKNGPIPHTTKTMISPTPSTVSEASTKHTVKSNSCEIKSEDGEESCSGKSMGHSTVGIPGLSNLSPPLSSGRATQPQNRAVRHIPNPSLLFNRQNSNNTNQIGSLIAPAPTTTNSTNASSPLKSSSDEINPFSLTSPIKLDEHPLLQVPAIPFPGVSVPVQVKVDNECLPIPIPIAIPTAIPTINQNSKTEADKAQSKILHQNELLCNNNKVDESHSIISGQTKSVELNENTISNKQNSKQLTEVESQQEPKFNLNANLISGGVHQIMEKESLEDLDQDIDVGTEMGPIFEHEEEEDVEKSKITVEDQTIHETAKIEAADLSPEIKPNEELSSVVNEVKDEQVEEVSGDKKVEIEVLESLKEIISAQETKSEINSEEIPSEIKTEKVSEDKPRQEIFDHDEMEIDTEIVTENIMNANIDSEKAPENSEGNQESIATIDLEVGIDEPMEVNTESSAKPMDNELEEKVQDDEAMPMESCTGENPESTEMEIEEEESDKVVGEIDSINSDEKTSLPIDTDIPMESIEAIQDLTTNQQDFNNLPQELMNNETEEKSEISIPISIINAQISFENTENIEMEEVNVPKAVEAIISISSPSMEKTEEVEETVELIEELKLPVVPSQESQLVVEKAEEDKNVISNLDLNSIPNEVTINPQPEAIEVQEIAEKSAGVQEKASNTNEAADCKESAEESINTLVEKPEAVELVKSTSQLEMNCIPIATGIETVENIIAEGNSNTSDNALEEIVLKSDLKENAEETVLKVEAEFPAQSSITESQPEAETEKGEDKSQNIIKPEDNSMDSILTEEKVEETPTETCLSVSESRDTVTTTSIPYELYISTIPEIPEKTFEAQEIVVRNEQEMPVVSMELISATATITTTTTTSDISSSKASNTVEIEVDVAEPSTLSTSICGNSLESQASQIVRPTNNLSSMETLEKVAAGFLASAASSINNNNNTSLTTMANPTCDITITTTNANAC